MIPLATSPGEWIMLDNQSRSMDGKTKTPVELAIAHILFIDIVGYSKLATKEQNVAVATLNELVQECEPFQTAERADRLLKIPTGDGMALVFYRSPEEPVQCAVALTRALKQDSNLQVRMGVHSGSVSGVADVTGRANVAGAGINIAQRVMDCADGGHILLSKHTADDLAEYERWRPMLHDLGPCEVKHGLNVHIVSLWNETVGNPQTPSKLQEQKSVAAGNNGHSLAARRPRLALPSDLSCFGAAHTNQRPQCTEASPSFHSRTSARPQRTSFSPVASIVKYCSTWRKSAIST